MNEPIESHPFTVQMTGGCQGHPAREGQGGLQIGTLELGITVPRSAGYNDYPSSSLSSHLKLEEAK